MLKSTREKIQRQEERDGKIAFFETQKQNLKNQKADTIEEIAKKLEKFHTYEDEIAAAKQALIHFSVKNWGIGIDKRLRNVYNKAIYVERKK